MAELKPCPFCGSADLDADDYSDVPHVCNAIERVSCNYCGAENIEADWNSRSLPAALDVVLEAVRHTPGNFTYRCSCHDADMESPYQLLGDMLEALKGGG